MEWELAVRTVESGPWAWSKDGLSDFYRWKGEVVGCELSGEVVGETQLLAVLIGVTHITSAGLTPAQKHDTPLSSSQDPCGLCWDHRG